MTVLSKSIVNYCKLFGTVHSQKLLNYRSVSAFTSPLQLQSDNLKLELNSKPKTKPNESDLKFGHLFTDHMLSVDWTQSEGWSSPRIKPLENLSLHPACKVFHYAQEVFEGMKAYRGVDGRIRLFRPDLNMKRMNTSAERSCMPTFDPDELLECIKRLLVLESDWVPAAKHSSLYIRPVMIGTEPTIGLGPANQATLFVILSPVGAYFGEKIKPISLYCDPAYVRATPGGSGYTKMGSNYAPTLLPQKMAEMEGCEQVLWVFGEEQEVSEVGAMNIFILMRSESGELELVTPPLTNGTILPGVTRQSVLELAGMMDGLKVRERRITLPELLRASGEERVQEIFTCGTAAIVSPVGRLKYQGEFISVPTPSSGLASQMLTQLQDIYYGKEPDHPWSVDIESRGSIQTKSSKQASQPPLISLMIENH